MSRVHRFEFSTRLTAAPAIVWAHAISLSGVNRELLPLARMTAPAGVEQLDPARVPRGQTLFRSWILFLGFLPVDYDDIGLAEFEPGHRFLERSTMLTQRSWQHERLVEPAGEGCQVTDRVEFEPRLALLGPLQALVFRAAFALRHWNLRRLFGSP